MESAQNLWQNVEIAGFKPIFNRLLTLKKWKTGTLFRKINEKAEKILTFRHKYAKIEKKHKHPERKII